MRLGIMQGRLSPPQGGALQFFPEDWEPEFATAHLLGFDSIEWIFDEPYEGNPLRTTSGQQRILDIGRESGVTVRSVCADVFMKQTLVRRDPSVVALLIMLLTSAERAGIPLVGLPLVEGNTPETPEQHDIVAENISHALALADVGTKIALEADLPAERIIALVEDIGSERVGVCYDTGNAMTFGFDAGADIRALGKRLFEIHFKDRIKGTRQSVYLGEGSVNFPDVFAALKEVGYDGLAILQAWRGEEYLADSKRQFEFLMDFIHT